MFLFKQKIKLTPRQEHRLEALVLSLGIHPKELLNRFVEEGLTKYAEKIRVVPPPAAPSFPLANGPKIPAYNSNIDIPPGKKYEGWA